MRVLIADDSKIMRKIFRSLLEGMKVESQDLFEAANGDEAKVTLAQAWPEIDLVISDWELPGLDGPAMLRKLREGGRKVPVLFCVGRDTRVPTDDGAVDYVERPFRDEVAQEKIRRLTAGVKEKEASEVLRTVASTAEVDLPFLLRLPSRVIEDFLRLARRVSHPAGTTLFEGGEIVPSFSVVTAGQVELIEPAGKVVQNCGDGDCFGELSFVLNQPSSVSARAKTAVEVATLSRPALAELVKLQPSVADFLSSLVSRRWKSSGSTRVTRGEAELMGSLESMPFADVIQLLHVTQKTGVLGLREGELSGGIYFQDGEAIHAWVGDAKGDDAFFRLSSLKKARFGFNSVPRKEPKTIQQPTMTILMEAMRRLDEGGRGPEVA